MPFLLQSSSRRSKRRIARHARSFAPTSISSALDDPEALRVKFSSVYHHILLVPKNLAPNFHFHPCSALYESLPLPIYSSVAYHWYQRPYVFLRKGLSCWVILLQLLLVEIDRLKGNYIGICTNDVPHLRTPDP